MTAPTTRSEQLLLIVFADLTLFQVHARRTPDLALADLLDAYYRHADALVAATRGTIIKFMGDALLAIWPQPQIPAALAALPQLKRDVDAWWTARAWTSQLIIKAHVGRAVVGPFGGDDRLDVIGTAVNHAATLPARTIALSADAFAHLDPAARLDWQPAPDAATYTPR
jgi:adenylate cyclase